MQQKIVDYKLCQRLAELGFECPSHTGWWFEYNSPIPGKDRVEYRHGVDAIDKSYADNEIKAYDCWDLLMWAYMTNPELSDKWVQLMEEFKFGLCYEPQNALAKAIIKILEERQ